jgi:alcohol dehydrogenase class IV
VRAVIEAGAVRQLRAGLDALGLTRVLLVTGGASFEASGAAAALSPQLAGLDVAHHRCATPNPTLEGAVEALLAFRAHRADVVVACGGGTPLDTAKLVIAFAGTDATPRAVAEGRAPAGAACPLVAVPTTAGTGSEATHFAVVYVDGHKRSVAAPGLRPVLALVDPDLTASLPPAITASTGLDALCQAVEAHWAVRATPASRLHSGVALSLVPRTLPIAVRAPTAAARHSMSRAAHHAGRAIDHTFTTACHALSYRLTHVHGVPHGHAVALFLAPVLRFNAAITEADALAEVAVTRSALADIVAAFGATDAEHAADRVTALIADVGLPTRLRDVGCRSSAQRAALVDAVNPERLANNPRRVDPASLLQIVEAVA